MSRGRQGIDRKGGRCSRQWKDTQGSKADRGRGGREQDRTEERAGREQGVGHGKDLGREQGQDTQERTHRGQLGGVGLEGSAPRQHSHTTGPQSQSLMTPVKKDDRQI